MDGNLQRINFAAPRISNTKSEVVKPELAVCFKESNKSTLALPVVIPRLIYSTQRLTDGPYPEQMTFTDT